jgi:flavin-dependent dehydrogenase
MNQQIEIVGGGLAGLSLGLALRRAGVQVCIRDAGTYPRHRVCGEFIAGLDPGTIGRLGLEPLLEDALWHREVSWNFPGRAPRLQRLPSPALGLSRYVLDARLADAFTDAGGTLHEGDRVTELESRDGRVFATGRPPGRSPWIGLKFHVHGLRLQCGLEMHLGVNAYVGLARVDADTVNVCGLFRRQQGERVGHPPSGDGRPGLLLEYLLRCGLDGLAGRLRVADIDAGSFCAVAGLSFDTPPAATDRIRLGDAFAVIPPFTGNGMTMAFQSAAEALAPLLRYSRGEAGWPETCRATNAALRSRFRLRLASANVVHNFLLQQPRQRWLAILSRARLLPLRPLYAITH